MMILNKMLILFIQLSLDTILKICNFSQDKLSQNKESHQILYLR